MSGHAVCIFAYDVELFNMILGPPNLPRYLVFLIYTSDDFHKNLAKKGRVIMLPVLEAMTAVLEAMAQVLQRAEPSCVNKTLIFMLRAYHIPSHGAYRLNSSRFRSLTLSVSTQGCCKLQAERGAAFDIFSTNVDPAYPPLRVRPRPLPSSSR